MFSGTCRQASRMPLAVEALARRARVGVYSLSSARVHFPAPQRADQPLDYSWLCSIVAEADRERHCAAVGRDRRCH